MVQGLEARPEISGQASPQPRMSYAEFLRWANEGTCAEWVNGEVILLSPASKRHQALGTFLLSILNFFVDFNGRGVVLGPPFQMKTGADLPGREPDLIFVSREHVDRLKENYLHGPADLVVEIISADSRSRDKHEKFTEYERGGVPEYWMLDRDRKRADFYQLDENGTHLLVPPDDDGFYHSAVLKGLHLRVEWFWEEPLPSLAWVLKELELI
jgi:Uma2 family endonuclease